MIIKEINEETYENFMNNNSLSSFYQSVEWKQIKEEDNKKCELLGLYEANILKGVSLVIYLKTLKSNYIAYASRGFVYEYTEVSKFVLALKEYFKNKKIIAFKMDPPLILATYDNKLNRTENVNNLELINKLKENGFIHFGFNQAFETSQFRFIHRIKLSENYNELLTEMSKSTRKNISIANDLGVRIKTVGVEELDEVNRLFNLTVDRKSIKSFSKEFYQKIMSKFKNARMYIAYIDKEIYLDNLRNKNKELEDKLKEIDYKMAHYNVGDKLRKEREIILSLQIKNAEDLKNIKHLDNYTNIASMLTITKYKEVVSFISGMDNNYRKFCPKYVMYPEMIKDAIKDNLDYVNFLGVKNIFDKTDSDYGMYEVKRGFGGETVEYIGEFILPIKPLLYKVYKMKEKIRG